MVYFFNREIRYLKCLRGKKEKGGKRRWWYYTVRKMPRGRGDRRRRRGRGRGRGNNLAARISRAYHTPGHPTAFSAPKTVADHFGITTNKARKVLEESDAYTLHREYKRPRVYNPYYVHNRRKQVQGDLVDISRIRGTNDGVTFLLVLIDIFTKKLWVFPLKNKSATVMKDAMKTWLDGLRTKPEKIVTDRGLEFTNRLVQNLLRESGVEWEAANGTMKAAIAERVNKTLQILIYKYLSAKETTRYIDVLPQLVQTYNRRPHRTLEGLTPNTADLPRNEALVQGVFHARFAKLGQARTSPKLSVGDIVRVKTDPHKISQNRRAYAEQYTGEYFRIVRINRTLPIPMYHLRSMDSLDFIEGGFYANELQRQRGDVWKVERILAERTRRGVREVLIKWKDFSDRWNSWEPRRNIVQRF